MQGVAERLPAPPAQGKGVVIVTTAPSPCLPHNSRRRSLLAVLAQVPQVTRPAETVANSLCYHLFLPGIGCAQVLTCSPTRFGLGFTKHPIHALRLSPPATPSACDRVIETMI